MTDHEIQTQLASITRLVHKFIRPGLDTENLVQDIWLECFENQTSPSYTMIRNRCYDLLRKRRNELKANEIRSIQGQVQAQVYSAQSWEVLEILLGQAGFSILDRLILRDKYWLGLGDQAIAEKHDLGLATVRHKLSHMIQRLKFLAQVNF